MKVIKYLFVALMMLSLAFLGCPDDPKDGGDDDVTTTNGDVTTTIVEPSSSQRAIFKVKITNLPSNFVVGKGITIGGSGFNGWGGGADWADPTSPYTFHGTVGTSGTAEILINQISLQRTWNDDDPFEDCTRFAFTGGLIEIGWDSDWGEKPDGMGTSFKPWEWDDTYKASWGNAPFEESSFKFLNLDGEAKNIEFDWPTGAVAGKVYNVIGVGKAGATGWEWYVEDMSGNSYKPGVPGATTTTTVDTSATTTTTVDTSATTTTTVDTSATTTTTVDTSATTTTTVDTSATTTTTIPEAPPCTHEDKEGPDGTCDECKEDVGDCACDGGVATDLIGTATPDGICDLCGENMPCEHEDTNDDGECDLCGENMPTQNVKPVAKKKKFLGLF